MLNELVESLVHELCDRLAVTAGIAETAKGMSIAFTSERGRIERDYFADESSPDAYIAAFLVPNAAKTIQCLLEMDAMGLIPRKEAVDVLDIGTGPGTSILAASIFFSRRYPDTAVRFAGIERSREALLAAHELFKIIAPPNHHFESATKEISPGELKAIMRGHRFDISIAANVLNELSSDDACDLCQDIISDHRRFRGASRHRSGAQGDCETAHGNSG